MKFLLIFLFLGCQTPTADPDKLYRKNMNLKINGVSASGTYVASKHKAFRIEAKFPASIEKLKLNSCHRYVVHKKVGRSWEYTYVQNDGIENVGLCVVDIGAFDEKGEHSWGMIEFINDEDVSLPAVVKCNGVKSKPVGVSICQSQKDLRQSIEFEEKTKVYAQDECDKPYTYDDKTFFYQINRGNCVFIFQQGKQFHRHRTFGYDDEL
jgi:hypothetical protein